MDNLSPRVLIIDDSKIDRRILSFALEKEGFTVLTAASGLEGLDIARSQRPDIILLDVVMPDMNGFDTCYQLQHDSRTHSIPVLFLSASDDLQSRLNGLTGGAVDYIVKPFNHQEILARIRIHLRIRRAFDALVDRQKAELRELQDAQQSILIQPREIPSANFDVYYRPLHEAGGDFYEVLELGQNIFGYFTADIGGHGLGAAFITSALKALLRQNFSALYTPVETMQLLNGVLMPILSDDVVLSACCVRLNRNTNRLVMVSAGHPPLILMQSNGEINYLYGDSDLLCAFENPHIESTEFKVSKGDRLLMFSDGLIESRHGSPVSRDEGLKGLVDAAYQRRNLDLTSLVQGTACSIYSPDEPAADDILLLGLEV